MGTSTGQIVVSTVPTDDELIAAIRAGDERAATELFERYYTQLVELARRHLGWHLKGIEGSSDLAQSVMRTVFQRASEDRVKVDSKKGLWPLLVTITLNKARNRARYYKRQRRDRRRDTPWDDYLVVLKDGPLPEDGVVVGDLIGQLLANFSERRRKILLLLLEDYTIADVAKQVGTTEWTVYKTRAAAAELLRGHFKASHD